MSSGRALWARQLLRGLTVDRRRPDLQALAGEMTPEQFVWRVLPHAARSFAASIVVLPPDQARAAAVAYLYCRMLDTYEDLIADADDCVIELGRFAARFDSEDLPPPPPIPERLARNDRDRVYRLLIARCGDVDSVFRTLPAEVRAQIRTLVQSMSEGMTWSTLAFARQGGILLDEHQLARYCRNVIGHPAVFALELVGTRELTEASLEDAFLVSEMVQLANVTRDIERDLARGVGYHPALKPYLGRAGCEPDTEAVVREVRDQFLGMALERAPAYRRLYEDLGLGETAAVRTAAVLMLSFTDLHYRSCAVMTGHPPWPGPSERLLVVAGSLPCLISPRWAERTVVRIGDRFERAANTLNGGRRRTPVMDPVQPAAGGASAEA